MDKMTGIFRTELTNVVQNIEKTLNELNSDNIQLRKQLVEVRQVAEQNACKVTELETKIDLVKRHSVANEQHSRNMKMRIFEMKQVRGENRKTIITEMIEDELAKRCTNR